MRQANTSSRYRNFQSRVHSPPLFLSLTLSIIKTRKLRNIHLKHEFSSSSPSKRIENTDDLCKPFLPRNTSSSVKFVRFAISRLSSPRKKNRKNHEEEKKPRFPMTRHGRAMTRGARATNRFKRDIDQSRCATIASGDDLGLARSRQSVASAGGVRTVLPVRLDDCYARYCQSTSSVGRCATRRGHAVAVIRPVIVRTYFFERTPRYVYGKRKGKRIRGFASHGGL